MEARWFALLVVAALSLTSDTAWAARRVFVGDVAARLGADNSNRGRQLQSALEGQRGVSPEADDLLELVHKAYDDPHFGHHGYGGCGCGYYYGYYGDDKPPLYGDHEMDSDVDFSHLIDTGASLGLLDPQHVRYDVYGMPEHGHPGDEAEMSRRALRAESVPEEGWGMQLIEKDFSLESYEKDYSEWEELPEAVFADWEIDAVWYGRYRGTATGLYSGCIGYYGYGYAPGYYGCGQPPYGGFDALVDDAEAAEELLLEVAEQLRDAVKGKAQENMEANAEEGYFGAYTTQPDDNE